MTYIIYIIGVYAIVPETLSVLQCGMHIWWAHACSCMQRLFLMADGLVAKLYIEFESNNDCVGVNV